MKFSIKPLIKREKGVDISSLHKRDISPNRDWVVMLSIFSGFILISIIVSTILFVSNFGDNDSSDQNNMQTQSYTDKIMLKNAVDYINSRSSHISTSTNQ